MIAAALLFLAAATADKVPYLAEAGDAPAITAERAVAVFGNVCVKPLPSPEQFVSAMNSAGVRWAKVTRSPEQAAWLGNSWKSEIGAFAYDHKPKFEPVTGGGTACHFAFHTDANYSHLQMAAIVAAAFGLGQGKNTGKRKQPQMQWETRAENGQYQRYFLTTRPDAAGGSEAILSVSLRKAG